ncbi:MAG: hypothetical protein IJP43_09400 [Oscillospiraceae bacterium]|nr:hypothetical protein [Oscillospiraceae bacterium]
MKKALALILALTLVFALAACSGGNSNTPAKSDTPSSTPAQNDTPANNDAPAAESKSYQLTGTYEEEGANASMLNAAFLLNLNADGTAVADRYKFGQYDASDAATNPTYEASFLSGTWKEVEKDGVACLQIKLAYVNEDGTTSNDQTAYAYDVAGEYSFDLTFPVVPGMSYSRVATLSGGETKTYADANAFIQAYKKEFTAPEHIAEFTSENGATAYAQEDGTLLIFVGYDQVAEGKWNVDESGVTVSVAGEKVDVTNENGAASFTFSRDPGNGETVDYVLTCADTSALGSVEVAADAPYTTTVALGDQQFPAELTLGEDGKGTFKAAVEMAITYEKVGNAVVIAADGELEGYAAQIFPNVPHAYLLNADKSMLALKGAYIAGDMMAMYLTSDTDMTCDVFAYGFAKDGFTYSLNEDATELTVTGKPAEMGAFEQVWAGAGADVFTLDGVVATAKA